MAQPEPAGDPGRTAPGAAPPAAFGRDHGCTAAEFVGWLAGACGAHPWRPDGDDGAVVSIGAGTLVLRWRALPPRRIALITLPRLHVDYRFDGVGDAERGTFLRYFDLFMQRGGG